MERRGLGLDSNFCAERAGHKEAAGWRCVGAGLDRACRDVSRGRPSHSGD